MVENLKIIVVVLAIGQLLYVTNKLFLMRYRIDSIVRGGDIIYKIESVFDASKKERSKQAIMLGTITIICILILLIYAIYSRGLGEIGATIIFPILILNLIFMNFTNINASYILSEGIVIGGVVFIQKKDVKDYYFKRDISGTNILCIKSKYITRVVKVKEQDMYKVDNILSTYIIK